MINEEQLTKWERLANEATEGPWAHPGRELVVSKSQKDEPVVADCNFPEAGQGPRNAAFIAASREAVPALVARVRELESMSQAGSDAYDRLLTEMDNKLRAVTNWVVNEFSRKGCPSGACRSDDCSILSCADCWRNKVHRVMQNA